MTSPPGHGAWGMGHGAWGMGHGRLPAIRQLLQQGQRLDGAHALLPIGPTGRDLCGLVSAPPRFFGQARHVLGVVGHGDDV